MTTPKTLTPIWGELYPSITWCSQLDGNLFHIAGHKNGNSAQRIVDISGATFSRAENGLASAMDAALKDIADELAGEPHLELLERIGPLPEPLYAHEVT